MASSRRDDWLATSFEASPSATAMGMSMMIASDARMLSGKIFRLGRPPAESRVERPSPGGWASE
jgi:hypothetical protein